MAIEWKKEYSVNIKVFDDQHVKLFGLINELYNAINTKQIKQEIEKTLNGLMDYGKYHLSLEEEYFDKYGYPGSKEHKEKHRWYIKKISAYQKKYTNKEIELTFALADFLEDWWIGHVNGVDKKYSEFFNDKGIY